MLSRWTFLYSSVSGACWPRPQGLVWSKAPCTSTSRWTTRVHWPFQLVGYFASSAARALAVVSINVAISAEKRASATTPAEIRFAIISSLHSWSHARLLPAPLFATPLPLSPRRHEELEIRRRLILPRRHQQTVLAQQIGFVAEHDPV